MSGPDLSPVSRATVLKLFQDLRASYWFIPVLMVAASAVLAQGMLWLDANDPLGLPVVLQNTNVDGARNTLTVIAQSVIGVTGVMFSMTVVAVSFAAGNFGPRLIGNFMRDTRNQISLGTLISIFAYCLLVLQGVNSPTDADGLAFVPHYALLMALGLALVAVVTMILYVHHIPETINVSNIAAGLGKRFCAAIEAEIRRSAPPDAGIDWPHSPDITEIRLDRRGYIQAFDTERLQELAQKHDWFIAVKLGAGRFVTPQRTVLEVCAKNTLTAPHIADLRGCFATGDSRREAQNIDFLLDQLVEMIARALSPGVNDPFTAINCLNWLAAGLSTALDNEGGLPSRKQGRVAVEVITFDALFTRAFDHSLPYLQSDALCCKHTLDLLDGLERLAGDTDRQTIAAMQSELRTR